MAAARLIALRRRPALRELERLGRQVAALQSLLERLCAAVYTHTRTDIAPDAALPEMRRLLREVRRRRR